MRKPQGIENFELKKFDCLPPLYMLQFIKKMRWELREIEITKAREMFLYIISPVIRF